ncbi:trehalose 6-phosphate phosphatase [Corynebacterium mycetoides]|uniref:Trehalose 6-phosphate phosphatase n=1 Tax=Corynebacterium mycetoides TaxID=38302 RepID=A0A1G9P0S3_9CORY|nr:trehalose-phosphatase [Corynebacterium mycetoides]SDL92472.1 trehalose 6-phosphate phosphatase [Corynebacterium mycetoides]
MTPELELAVGRAAAAETLLVCLDFDGTLAELGPDAYAVRPHPGAMEALEALMELPSTQVAVLTGRHLAGLRRVLPLGGAAVLVGSHGAEPSTEASGAAPALEPEDAAYLDDIEARLERLAVPPAFVEVKPYQRVVHVAALAETDPARARRILDAARELDTAGRPVISGHNVVEFSATDITKGSWLASYKKQFAATLFAGDDTTDETALETLDEGDVGIKVGPKPTVAPHRVAGVDEMARVLTHLAAARRRFAREQTGSGE